MLQLENVYKSFGGIVALYGVSFHVDPHSITGLIGPNGSGKSTSFNVISGFYSKDKGDIYFKGKKIENIEPHKIAMMGIGRTFQISEAPEKMTVLEKIRICIIPSHQLNF